MVSFNKDSAIQQWLMTTAAISPHAFGSAMYLIAPGWTIMVLSFRPLMIGLVVWHLAGLLVLSRAKTRQLQMSVFLVFVFPLLLSPIALPFYVAYLQPCNVFAVPTPTTKTQTTNNP